jgi:hypothetical protein
MRIENGPYVAIIDAFRVANWHERIRFHYTIIRRTASPLLMVSGSAETEVDAKILVQKHFEKFAAHDAARGAAA